MAKSLDRIRVRRLLLVQEWYVGFALLSSRVQLTL